MFWIILKHDFSFFLLYNGAKLSKCQSCVCEKGRTIDIGLSGLDKARAISSRRHGAEFNSIFDERNRCKHEEAAKRKTGRRCRREEQGTPTISSLRTTLFHGRRVDQSVLENDTFKNTKECIKIERSLVNRSKFQIIKQKI